MEMKRAALSIVSVTLILVLAMASLEGRRALGGIWADEGGGRAPPEVNKEMAMQTFIYCRKYLIEKEGASKDVNPRIQQEATRNLQSALLPERNIYELISLLPPQVKEIFLVCLREKDLVFQNSGPEAIFSWCMEFVEFVLNSPNAPRRYLLSDLSQQDSGTPILALESAPETELSQDLEKSYLAPTSYLSARTHHSDTALYQLLLISNKVSSSESEDTKGSKSKPPSSSNKPSPPAAKGKNKKLSRKEQEDIDRELMVAVVATAASTFTLVALLFFCCLKVKGNKNKISPREEHRDGRPLLDLLDFSGGSPQQSISLGSSNNKDFCIDSVKNLSAKPDNCDTSLAQAEPLEATAGTPSLPPVKPPPGGLAPPPGLHPPPPPKACPPMPPKSKLVPPAPRRQGNSASSEPSDESGAPKTKLKPFFWDKVLASPGHSMVWDEISGGSFQFNEEMIESLFGYTVDHHKNDQRKDLSQYIKIIDPRKAQNLSILLRALNVTTAEVVDALQECNELPTELLSTLLKMAPTQDEELKLRLYTGDLSLLGPAERFLKVLVEIPFAFKRIESLLFMSSLEEEFSSVKDSFKTLEVACDKLKSSRLFLKLLEAVLKTGNRMNDGTYRGGASAFRLDTLLKLSDVKGTDGKTTLLHFVVQEIIRTEGIKAIRALKSNQSISSSKSVDLVEDPNQHTEECYFNLGLQVVSVVGSELQDVKKAAVIDADALTTAVLKLNSSLSKIREFLNNDMKNMNEECEFVVALSSFIDKTDADIRWLSVEEKRIMALIKSTADYFHGNSGRDEGLRLFAIIRDFLMMVDKVCNEVREARMKHNKTSKKEKEAASVSASPDNRPPISSDKRHPFKDMRERLFPAIQDRRMESSSSDDESP
ncbi:hypothetical protein SLE2022_051470 [Rubroshorea leprosula]